MPYVSLHGRALGFDTETGAIIRNGSEGGSPDQITAGSTATTISPRGTTTLATTAATAYTLAAPVPGLTKRLVSTGVSTAARTVTLESGTIASTIGSTPTTMTFTQFGQAITLQAISTSRYQVMANQGAVTFST